MLCFDGSAGMGEVVLLVALVIFNYLLGLDLMFVQSLGRTWLVGSELINKEDRKRGDSIWRYLL